MTDQLTQDQQLAALGRYEYGWADSDVAGSSAQRGLNEAVVRGIDPGTMVGYANFPSTEYLETDFTDFLAFNVYLHRPADFRRYLVLSEGGWFSVVKHQPTLRSVARIPAGLLGPIILASAGLDLG